MRKHFTSAKIRNYLVTGIFIWVPILITYGVINYGMRFLTNIFESMLDLVARVSPETWHEPILAIKSIPFLGVILVVTLLFLTGLMAANLLGQWFLRIINSLLSRIPIVKSVYGSVKQVSDTLFSSNGQAFRHALLVQYPREGSWTVAFQTGTPSGDVATKLPADCISVYVPTTPNPTSGFFLIMRKTDVILLDMSVDEALKYIISMGVVAPDEHIKKTIENHTTHL